MSDRCPHCGFNLNQDHVVERDGFVLDPRGGVRFKGRLLSLRPSGRLLMHALAAEQGRVCPEPMLRGRLGSEADSNVINAQVWHLRLALKQQNVPSPVKTIWGAGYAWEMAA